MRAREQLGGRRCTRAAKGRPFERGNGHEVQTVDTSRPRLCPPSSRPPGPRAPSTPWNPVFSGPASRWVGGCWGVQVCAVGGTAAPQPQTLVPQARWHKKAHRRTAEGNSCGPAASGPIHPGATPRAQCQHPAGFSLLRLCTKCLHLVAYWRAKALTCQSDQNRTKTKPGTY